MKSIQSRKLLLLILAFILASCGVGGFYMEGVSGDARESYLDSIKPYIHYWKKKDAMDKERLDDSTSCGGGKNASHNPSFSREQIQDERKSSNVTENVARTRLFHAWERCMLRKNYVYTGRCIDNEVSRAKPACGAP